MLSDERAREIALFFLFSLMDEKTALAAAHKAVAAAKASAPNSSKSPSESAIVTVLRKQFDSHRKQLPRNRPIEMPTCWKIESGIDSQAWTRFHKDSSDGEIVALVLSRILGYSEEAVAEGLNVTVGTLRYRVAKGMRQLGSALGRSPGAVRT